MIPPKLSTFLFLLFAGLPMLPPCAAQTQSTNWVGSWAASPMATANKGDFLVADTTLRQTVHVSLGGNVLRVVFTNEFGVEPLRVGGAQVSFPGASASVPVALTFAGQPGVTIPPGALVVSDPASINLRPLSDLLVTMFMPAQPMQTLSFHGFADQTNFMATGNQLSASVLTNPRPMTSWYFLKDVEVSAPAGSGSIVTFGDSITDGALSTKDMNARWPDVLARRLQGDKKTAQLGVLNQGIGGNRLLHDTTGPSALARFDRDVLAQPGVRYVIVLEGINDIGHAADPVKPYDIITATDLKFALQQLIDRAHARGIKVIGATLTPYGKANYASPAGETLRQAENGFIRNSGQFDGVIDFDKLTADPAQPSLFLPAYDSGDSLHPRDAGYKAMGEGIDLTLFQR